MSRGNIIEVYFVTRSVNELFVAESAFWDDDTRPSGREKIKKLFI